MQHTVTINRFRFYLSKNVIRFRNILDAGRRALAYVVILM